MKGDRQMSILDYLYEKYGKDHIDEILYNINHDDRNFKILFQRIKTAPVTMVDDISYYHTHISSELGKYIHDRRMLYEIVNAISRIDFTFKKYNTCITYGTFDLFHIGHLRLLQRIKAMCSTLIVAVSTDEFNSLKGKKCIIPYDQRAAIVGAIEYVDLVIPETNWEQKSTDIEKYQVNAFVMGNDWEGKFDFLKDKCDVVYLPRTDGISSTEIKTYMKENV